MAKDTIRTLKYSETVDEIGSGVACSWKSLSHPPASSEATETPEEEQPAAISCDESGLGIIRDRHEGETHHDGGPDQHDFEDGNAPFACQLGADAHPCVHT